MSSSNSNINEDAPTIESPLVAQDDTTQKSISMKYIVFAILILGVCIFIYWAYTGFNASSKEVEPMTAGLKQERDDLLADFNLRETIKQLSKKQEKILKGITSATDI